MKAAPGAAFMRLQCAVATLQRLHGAFFGRVAARGRPPRL
jgi:hypothetical protein